MTEDAEQRIEVPADEALSVISGLAPMDTFGELHGDAIVHVDGIKMCKVNIEDGEYTVTHLACSDPRHGVHPSLHEITERMKASLRKIGIKDANPDECSMCNGDEWIHAQSGFARRLVLMASIFGMFRGVQLKVDKDGDELPANNLRDMLGAFLADPGTPTGPTGPQPARAIFSSQAEEGDEGNDDE